MGDFLTQTVFLYLKDIITHDADSGDFAKHNQLRKVIALRDVGNLNKKFMVIHWIHGNPILINIENERREG